MNKKLYAILTTLIFFPTVSFAALEGLKGLIISLGGIINLLIPVVFGLGLIYFLWGGAQFILHSDVQAKREEGKKQMLWGIVALFVMISIYGIIRLIGGTLGIPGFSTGNGTISVPYNIGGNTPIDMQPGLQLETRPIP